MNGDNRYSLDSFNILMQECHTASLHHSHHKAMGGWQTSRWRDDAVTDN